MSRTDAHLPYTALMQDPKLATERHDHRVGPCDILPLSDWIMFSQANKWSAAVRKAYRCGWDVNWKYFYEHNTCGCDMCTNRTWRRQEIKRKRANKRREVLEQTTPDTWEGWVCEDCGQCTAWECRGDANYYYVGRDYEFLPPYTTETPRGFDTPVD